MAFTTSTGAATEVCPGRTGVDGSCAGGAAQSTSGACGATLVGVAVVAAACRGVRMCPSCQRLFVCRAPSDAGWVVSPPLGAPSGPRYTAQHPGARATRLDVGRVGQGGTALNGDRLEQLLRRRRRGVRQADTPGPGPRLCGRPARRARVGDNTTRGETQRTALSASHAALGGGGGRHAGSREAVQQENSGAQAT